MDLTYREFAWATDLKKKWYVGNTHSASLVVDVRERSWLFLVDEFRWSETSKLPVIIVLIADMIQYAQRFLSKQAAIISHRIVHIYSYLPVWFHVRVCFTFFTLSSHNNFLWVHKAANNGTPTVDQLSDDLECLKGRRGISSVEFNLLVRMYSFVWVWNCYFKTLHKSMLSLQTKCRMSLSNVTFTFLKYRKKVFRLSWQTKLWQC